MPESDVRRIPRLILFPVADTAHLAGSAAELAKLLGNAEPFTIPRRDHMRATGDPAFKNATLDFLSRHPA